MGKKKSEIFNTERFNPWKKENRNKQETIAKDLGFGVEKKYKKGDEILYLSFGTNLKFSDDYNVYIISPGIIEKVTHSKIDGVTRYDIKGEDYCDITSSAKYIKPNL